MVTWTYAKTGNEEEKDYFAKVRAGSADKGNVKTLKTANLANRTPLARTFQNRDNIQILFFVFSN